MLDNKILRNQLISRRTFLIGIGKVSLLSILFGKMFYMQCIKKDEYTTLSDKNRINMVIIPPMRGEIFDRNREVLATSKLCFRLLLDKNNNYKEELLLIAKILEFNEEQYLYISRKVEKANRRIPTLILDQLDWQQIARIEEYKHKLYNIFVDIGQVRFYPVNQAISHLIGYIGPITDAEAQSLSIINRESNIGKSGIEKFYENDLRGTFGYKQIEVNAFGKSIRQLKKHDSIAGSSITLNVDKELQEKIMPYLNPFGCSAIVMDCNNGEILLSGITPSFEINNFIKLSKDYWRSLIDDPYKPLINKMVQNSYPPGSVFKIITILAALEAGIDPNKIVRCTGAPFLSDGFRCASKTGHGDVGMVKAIQCSCNTYMYNVAKLIGADRIIDMAKKFGFGRQTKIDLPNEASGFVPTKKWKKTKLKSEWSLGDTLNLSIGQGFLLVTPIQLLCFTAAIANGGKLYVPRVAKNEPSFIEVDIKQDHLDIVREGMYNAVNSVGGTAYNSRLSGVDKLAGKTGTAQVRAKINASDDLNRKSIAWARRNHAAFIGFAPYDTRRYAVTVFVDHGGGGGGVAAPIASKVMHDVLQKYNGNIG